MTDLRIVLFPRMPTWSARQGTGGSVLYSDLSCGVIQALVVKRPTNLNSEQVNIQWVYFFKDRFYWHN